MRQSVYQEATHRSQLLRTRLTFSWSVMVSVAVSTMGMTELIFFDPRVKVNRQYYCDVLLSQQMLPAINRVAERCLFTSSVLLTAKFVIFCVL